MNVSVKINFYVILEFNKIIKVLHYIIKYQMIQYNVKYKIFYYNLF